MPRLEILSFLTWVITTHRLPRLENHVFVRDHRQVNYPLDFNEQSQVRNNMYVRKTTNRLHLAQIKEEFLDTSGEEKLPPRENGESQPGKASNLNRDRRLFGHIFNRQNFSTSPIYDHAIFQRRLRVMCNIFERLSEASTSPDSYFSQKRDCTGLLGTSPLQVDCWNAHYSVREFWRLCRR